MTHHIAVTAAERSTILNALAKAAAMHEAAASAQRDIAACYREHGTRNQKLEAPSRDRLADQHAKQAADARELARRIEESTR